MALDKGGLETAIVGLLTDMRSRQDISDLEYAERLASAIYAFVLTADVKPGIPVVVGTDTGATTDIGKLQ